MIKWKVQTPKIGPHLIHSLTYWNFTLRSNFLNTEYRNMISITNENYKESGYNYTFISSFELNLHVFKWK